MSEPEGDVDIQSEDDRLAMEDAGRAAVWKDLSAGTRHDNRCSLLSERFGLTVVSNAWNR